MLAAKVNPFPRTGRYDSPRIGNSWTTLIVDYLSAGMETLPDELVVEIERILAELANKTENRREND
jgi:hypothetical protein